MSGHWLARGCSRKKIDSLFSQCKDSDQNDLPIDKNGKFLKIDDHTYVYLCQMDGLLWSSFVKVGICYEINSREKAIFKNRDMVMY